MSCEQDEEDRTPGKEQLLADSRDVKDPENPVKAPYEVGTQFDELLIAVGKFGRYQQFVVFLVLLPAFFAYSFSNGFWLFVIAAPDKFWCRIPENLSDQLKPLDVGEGLDQQCQLLFTGNGSNTTGGARETGNLSVLECDYGWDFDQTVFTNTIVSEFGLVCGANFLPTLVYVIISLVGTLGAPVGGYFSDHFGRKRTYFLFLSIELVSGVAAALAPSYWTFVVLSSVHAVGVYPTYQALYTLGLEILSPDYRTTFSVLLSIFYALGNIACSGCAYFLRDWRMLVLSCSLPLVCLLGFWWPMPESPRYNLGQRKFSQVEHFFRRAAKWNSTNFDDKCKDKLNRLFETICDEDDLKHEKSYSFRHLFDHVHLRRRTLSLIYLSAVVAISYGGLGFYAPQLGTNPHLNVFLTSLVDLPAALLTQLIADRLGRRLTLAVDFLFGGVICLATLAFSSAEESYYPVLLLFLLARMFAVSSYTVEELVACENFPTILRGEGISLTNGVSGVISNLGPLIVYLNVGGASLSPMAWFGCVTILGSLVVLVLPETVDKPLPETLDDVPRFRLLRSWQELFSVVRHRTRLHD